MRVVSRACNHKRLCALMVSPMQVTAHEILWMDRLDPADRRLQPFAAALSLNTRQHHSENQDDADERDDQHSDASSSSTTR
jgi:hypothetical protein